MCERHPTITVYESPNCFQCRATKAYLDRAGVDFETVDLSTDDQSMAAMKDLGYRQAPVVFVRYPGGSETHWSGFQPSRLDGFIATAKRWADG